MTAFGIPDFDTGGNGLVLTKDDRLEALQWALSECETWSEVLDIMKGAPFRSLTKHAGEAAERAALMLATRWREIDARDRAADAARRNPGSCTHGDM